MTEQEQTASRTLPTGTLQEENGIRAEVAAERPAEQEKKTYFDPVLESPRFKGRRVCYQRCPNMASKNIVACELCRHQYHIECIGGTPEDSDDVVLRCEFCPDFEESEQNDEDPVRPGAAQETSSENRCPCGDETVKGFFVKCRECDQVFHGQCVDVLEEQAGNPFVCWSCDVVRRMDETTPEATGENGHADSCPCGKRTPLSSLVRCRVCNQAYHPGCDDGRTNAHGYFKCSACIQESLADELTARNIALRENQDQGEILKGLTLPKVSSRGAEHAQRFLQNHLQRMAGEESFVFGESEHDGNAVSFLDEQPLHRPEPKQPESVTESSSLIDRLTANVEIGKGDSFVRPAKETPSANPGLSAQGPLPSGPGVACA